ncbi:hypothetical protein A3A38_00965 [Candidatus Kaiserbacteria bacterium RIFCSPLOWO2_01_FULL_53_17]|uniref:Uncharacterized protein n=1 Tax=Candidatus Kaiserbacteria bacterium RIFCSPLOWO2_01_FULL_53_17 TaxID=1798511 RepID=A0A1F6EH99_9BACT|nr:MAG: hypothetical protein A3A38_00965 [Candidatus Kaiserbacteria bacterium RIFCSPLOWO2_01_FULL_53_17]
MSDIATNLTERALRGIRALTAVKPDWRTKIKEESFDMQLSERCVLGQVFGHFDKGMQALNLQHGEDGITHGFQLRPAELASSIPEWNRIWRSLIRE